MKRLSAIARLGERKEERGGGGGEGERSEESEAEVDLREIINRKNKNTERYDVYNVWVYVSEMIVATYPSLSPLLPPSCPLSLSLSLSLFVPLLLPSSSTRFVVTLAGAGEEYTNNSTSDLDEEETAQQEATKEIQKTLLSRNRRFNRQAVVETEAVSRNVTEIAGEEEAEEDGE